MINYKKILVVSDCSEASTIAIRHAGELAEQFDGEVHLLHVTEPSLYFETDMVAVPPLEDMDEAMQKGALRRLKAQVEQFHFKIVVHLKESVGDPSRTICQFAKSLPANLMIIGRHEEKGVVKHMLMGSTTERVVAHAPCPVLVTMAGSGADDNSPA